MGARIETATWMGVSDRTRARQCPCVLFATSSTGNTLSVGSQHRGRFVATWVRGLIAGKTGFPVRQTMWSHVQEVRVIGIRVW
jgi:hypothetical protein